LLLLLFGVKDHNDDCAEEATNEAEVENSKEQGD